MALDRMAPVYTGKDPNLKQIAEYENYLREQMAHELEVLKKQVAQLQSAANTVRETE